jgi:PAS domain S-box-containing protein
MNTADRVGDGAGPVGDPRDDIRKTIDDAQRASDADQVAADADQVAADVDQTLSDADQSASNADQRSTSIDQLASDRDQLTADRQHAAGAELTPADEQAYEASRNEREAVSVAREKNRVKRARTAGRRDTTAGKRDRSTETRGEGGRARDARVVIGQHAIDAWEILRLADDEAIRESGAKYRGLLEAAPDAMVVVNQAGEIVLLNLQAEKQFGYHRDELVGQRVTNILPEGFAERLIADDLRSAADALAQQIGTGIELTGRRKDGSEFPIEIMLSPLESAEGVLVTAAIRNISVRMAAEQERTRLVSAVEQTADSISMHGLDGTVTYVNSAFTRVYGYESREIVGRHGGMIDSGLHNPSFFEAIRASASAGRTWTGTIVNRRKDGTLIEVETVISAIHDADGRVASYVQADRDVTRERELERALERDARERQAIETALARIDPAMSAEEVAAAACAVISELPGVDSTWAAVLDEVEGVVLAATGQLTPTFARGRLIPASRIEYLFERGSGGAWFEEWRPRSDDGAWAEAVTSTGLRAMAYAPLRSPRGMVGVVGIGSHDPLTAQSLVEHVPALATFASILGAQLVPKLEGRRRDVEGKSVIRAVLDTSAFGPFFQPIVDLHTGAVVGYEALTRFADGVPPATRFAAAALAGLAFELEMATLRAALAAATAVLPPETYLSLNASPALIGSGSLRTLFAGLSRPIVLEITEHVAIDDYVTLRAALADLGPTVRLAVDDAGAGYASFRHILELAPDLVKLDIGLIRGIDGDPPRQALIAGMAYFAVKRKLRLIAEGIETHAELEMLRSLAVGYGQGYLLGRPQDSRGPEVWPTRISLSA